MVKNTHKCFLINHMEGKLAKHSDFFPIIEFLHLKSLNSNSQQFHVLLLRFEILTVTDRSASQAGWMTFYYFTVLLSPNNTHYITLVLLILIGIVSSRARWCFKLWKVFNPVSDIRVISELADSWGGDWD